MQSKWQLDQDSSGFRCKIMDATLPQHDAKFGAQTYKDAEKHSRKRIQ